jgi:predicted Zn-dependent peptidase
MKEIKYPRVNEKIYLETLENGLKVYMVEKPNFSKSYALFSTAYGSVNSEFIPINEEAFIKVPDGVAHFLEHKLFDQEDGTDVFELFSKQSASANAYTSYSKTAYLFSCTDKLEDNLELLLDYVQEPYFTDETVEKEKGIIEQELKMYLDMPHEVLMLGILENLFHSNPVRIDVGGTVESIYQIDKEVLYTCYNTFYHPSNMSLIMVGNFDSSEMIEQVKANQNKKEFAPFNGVTRKEVIEPNEVNKKSSTIDFKVTTPMVSVGIKTKNPYIPTVDKIKRQISLSILFDGLFAKSSSHYQKLIKEGIINDSFSYYYSEEPSFGYGLISCDTHKHQEFKDEIKRILLSEKIDQDTFTRIKKLKIGEYMNQFDSVDYIARQLLFHLTNDYLMFDLLDQIEALSKEEFDTIINDFLSGDVISDCTVLSKTTLQ